MPYTPNTWQARQGSGLNRFQDQNGTLYEFTAAPAEVTQPGTPFSADWMNHLEQGVAAAQSGADALEASRGQPDGLATLDSAGKLTTGQFPDPNDVGVYNLEAGEAIPSGADLNDYVTPGTYTFLGSDASSISNYPPGIAKLTFRLTVMKTGNTTLLQIFVCTDVVCIRYNNRYDNTDHYGSWRQIAAEDDTGWQTPTLSSAFKLYNSAPENAVRYRRKNGVVTVTGVVSPASNTNDIGSSTRVDIFTLPEGYRPATNVVIMCQGTSRDVWTLVVNAGSGTVGASRYRDETGYVTPDTTAWMPFTVSFIAE